MLFDALASGAVFRKIQNCAGIEDIALTHFAVPSFSISIPCSRSRDERSLALKSTSETVDKFVSDRLQGQMIVFALDSHSCIGECFTKVTC